MLVVLYYYLGLNKTVATCMLLSAHSSPFHSGQACGDGV